LDPRFKDQFVSNRIEFVSNVESWIMAEIGTNENKNTNEINELIIEGNEKGAILL
jgi:hypothetical protein